MGLPRPCLVVLVGASGAGKSTWAASRFAAGEIVSSDRLRAAVGEAEDDLEASADAFAVLDAIVDARLRRKLTVVVDTLGLDAARRRALVVRAAAHGVPAVAVVFDLCEASCRARNASRPRPLPVAVLASQVRRVRAARAEIAGEGFAAVEIVAADAAPPTDAALGGRRGRQLADAPLGGHRGRQLADTSSSGAGLRFGLHVSRFDWSGGAAGMAARLRRIGAEAAEAGFESIWVMDHLRQIPQVGRPYEDLPEAFTTLGFLAACTQRMRIGALVAGITYRTVSHLARVVATLDVLSGGRAVCGLGVAWFEEEHVAAGLRFPPLAERYDLLADALELLPLLWGPGAPAYAGRRLVVPSAGLYPRPLQERVPIIVGGSGERRTLRLVAEHADGDQEAIEVTHLSTALAAATPDELAGLVVRLRPGRVAPSRYAASVGAATVEDLVRRFAGLRDAGVQTAIVRLADLGREPAAIERFAPVIAAFAR